MSELHELQKAFQAYLLSAENNIQKDIVNTTQLDAGSRLNIYREAYYQRLQDALRQDYAVLANLLGEEAFVELSQQYIEAYPSTFRSIRWYGKHMAHFMQTFSTFLDSPWLIEMAQFEWFLTETFDAHDDVCLTIAELASVPFDEWPALAFLPHASLRRLNLSWNIVPLWTEITEHKTAIAPQSAECPVSWVIWRREYDIQFCSLTVDEAYMVDAIIAGKNFSEICVGLCEWIEEQKVGFHAATLLKRFMTEGWIVGFKLA